MQTPAARLATVTQSTACSRAERRRVVIDLKRQMILDAAQRVFVRDGLTGANMRAIAREAGYAASALYKYYTSKEDIYADLLTASLERLREAVEAAALGARDPAAAVQARALAFFDFYMERPRDLDLGFYLFQGLNPIGLTPELDSTLNRRLGACLDGIRGAMRELGASDAQALRETTALFAHCVGILMMVHTGRIRMFRQNGREMFKDYVDTLPARCRMCVAQGGTAG
jgi:AcrR family transcriptional regulator